MRFSSNTSSTSAHTSTSSHGSIPLTFTKDSKGIQVVTWRTTPSTAVHSGTRDSHLAPSLSFPLSSFLSSLSSF